MAISTAVDLGRVSNVVGYKLKSANFGTTTPYLPQRIAILGEANTANQGTLSTAAFEFINAKEVGDKYGYGSPLYQIARILRPVSGSILGGIPTVIYPQASDGGATATVITLGVAVATTVTANATHKLLINGRDNIDGKYFTYNVVSGENQAAVTTKIIDAVNNVIGSPVSAALAITDVALTSKWSGATSAQLNITVDTQGEDAGIVYSEVSKVNGTGTVSISAALALFGSDWNTIVINPYDDTVYSDLETFNGVPDPDTPTGRYLATDFKPFMAFHGDVSKTKAAVIALTDASARKTQVTNVFCPAPGSSGFTWEAAANMVASTATIMNNTPHLGNADKYYPDMPTPTDGDIGDFGTYDGRDYMVKRGASTVVLSNGKYQVKDLVNTYHPDGEVNPKFRKVRDLNIDWNIAFGWLLIMQRDIQNNAIVGDSTLTTVSGVIKPKQAKQLAVSYINQNAERALLVDTSFSEDSLQVGINESNPARLDIFFRYKRSSTADIVSTDVEVDFAFTL